MLFPKPRPAPTVTDSNNPGTCILGLGPRGVGSSVLVKSHARGPSGRRFRVRSTADVRGPKLCTGVRSQCTAPAGASFGYQFVGKLVRLFFAARLLSLGLGAPMWRFGFAALLG